MMCIWEMVNIWVPVETKTEEKLLSSKAIAKQRTEESFPKLSVSLNPE